MPSTISEPFHVCELLKRSWEEGGLLGLCGTLLGGGLAVWGFGQQMLVHAFCPPGGPVCFHDPAPMGQLDWAAVFENMPIFLVGGVVGGVLFCYAKEELDL